MIQTTTRVSLAAISLYTAQKPLESDHGSVRGNIASSLSEEKTTAAAISLHNDDSSTDLMGDAPKWLTSEQPVPLQRAALAVQG